MKFKDPELVLLSAFRYALGRRTYIVSTIVDEIVTNWNVLSDSHKKLIQTEIIDQQDMGMSCDVAQWQSILNLPI